MFGREEEDSRLQFRQQDIDELVAMFRMQLDATFVGGRNPLHPGWSEMVLNVSVSDVNKALLLQSPDLTKLLLLGLFIDPAHPRGTDAAPPATPTPEAVQTVFQRNFAEALEQLALFEPGRDWMLQDGNILEALEEVVAKGMSSEAKEFARGALIALHGVAGHEAVVAEHVMLSYSWDEQDMIVKIAESLKRRQYNRWLDTEQMKGSIMDAMSDAVEGAAVVLYGVSKGYKESANCRLEANYAMQQE